MNITVNITEPVKRVQEFREYDLGQITTTLQDLLDSSSIIVDSNIIPILKVLSIDNIIKFYLIKDLTENLYNTEDYITGQDLIENDLIPFISESQIIDLQNKLEDALIIQQSTYMGNAVIGGTPSGSGARYWTATQAGTYTNFGGVVVSSNSFAVISRDSGGVFSISQTTLDVTGKLNVSDVINNLTSTETAKPLSAAQGKLLNEKNIKIEPWTAKLYALGDQVNHLGKDWVSNAATVAGDVPGVSSKWVERLGGYAEQSDLDLTNDKVDLIVSPNFVDLPLVWIPGYIDYGNVNGAVGNWKYTSFPALAGKEYTLYRDAVTLWPSSGSFHHIYFYNAVGIVIGNYINEVVTSSFITPVGTVSIALSAESIDDQVSSVRLVNGLASPYDSYSSNFLDAEYLANYFYQGVRDKAKFIKPYSILDTTTAIKTAGYFEGGIAHLGVIGSWHIVNFIPSEENTSYKFFFNGNTLWATSSYREIVCYSDDTSLLSNVLGVVAVSGGIFKTLPGTKYIAYSVESNVDVIADNRICIDLTANYTNEVKYTLTAKEDGQNLSIAASELLGELKDETLPSRLKKIQKISLIDSDKIICIGNSYTSGGSFSLKKKQYTYLISMLSDFQIINYGIGAVTLEYVYGQLIADAAVNGWGNPSKLKPTYAIIAEAQNSDAVTSDNFYITLIKLCNFLESQGITPILSTEHHTSNGFHQKMYRAYQHIADERGYTYVNWAQFATNVKSLGFYGFTYGSHVGTRSYWIWANRLIRTIENLPINKSMKLFRKRSSVDFTTLPIYLDNAERGKYFEELTIGGMGATDATEKYIDRSLGIIGEAIACEYNDLLNGTSVNVGSYLLAEIITDVSKLDYGVLNILATNVTSIKLKKHDNTWTSAISFAGKINISSYLSDIPRKKVSILLIGNGSDIILTSIDMDYSGISNNKVKSKKIQERQEGLSLISPLMESTDWVGVGSLPVYTPIVDAGGPEPLPTGITKVIELNSSSLSLTQLFDTPIGDAYFQNKYQIRLLCRNFPKYIASDGDWATTEITKDTFDMAKVNIAINDGQGVTNIIKYVGLWWDEIIIDQSLNANIADCSISISSPDSKNIQIAKVEIIPFK